MAWLGCEAEDKYKGLKDALKSLGLHRGVGRHFSEFVFQGGYGSLWGTGHCRWLAETEVETSTLWLSVPGRAASFGRLFHS